MRVRTPLSPQLKTINMNNFEKFLQKEITKEVTLVDAMATMTPSQIEYFVREYATECAKATLERASSNAQIIEEYTGRVGMAAGYSTGFKHEKPSSYTVYKKSINHEDNIIII